MAHTLSGMRNIRRNENRRVRNKAEKSRLRGQMRKVLTAVAKKEKSAASTELKAAYKLLDRAASAKVIHRNAAARYKSRLAEKVAAIK